MTTPRELGDRQTVLIPPDLYARFAVLIKRNEHKGAFLAWCWLSNAVLDARAGRPLPPDSGRAQLRVPSPGRDWPQLRWRQSDVEFAAWRRELEGVGSSPKAVIRHRVARYVEAGGDPLATEPGPLAACST